MVIAARTEDLSKTFGTTHALVSLNIEMPQGEVLGYLGPNGAGKTTTIRLLLGLIGATSGRAEIFGVDCQADPVEAHRRVAYVPGEVNLWPSLTGEETLHLLGRVQGHVDVAYRDVLIERFEFDPSKKVRAYSKGNRQKLILIAGSDDQGRSAAPRRADERPRPADGAGVPRVRGRCPRAWPDGVPVVPHPVGGRGALRPGRDPARGPSGGGGDHGADAPPLRAAGRGRARRDAARRVERPGRERGAGRREPAPLSGDRFGRAAARRARRVPACTIS